MKGSPTKKRYAAATVFVDHFSRLSFIFLQKSTSAEETIQAKEAYERFASSHGVKVQHYHADNGRFAENRFVEHVKTCGQTLSFCGVNAHHQNGIAERRIRHLQDQARTMLIHGQRRWPEAIDAHLWPYALRMANEVHNSVPLKSLNHKTPISLFSGSSVASNPKHFYPLGCPVYVLDSALQQGKKIGKWRERSRIGIYLGQSSGHSRSVALVLNPKTGLVSPQFHVRMDPTFQTIKKHFYDNALLYSWQETCGFRARAPGKPASEGGTSARPPPRPSVPPTAASVVPLPSAQADEPSSPAQRVQWVDQQPIPAVTETTLPEPSPADAAPSGLRRSSRPRHPNPRHLEFLKETLPSFVAHETLLDHDADIDPLMDVS
jgi:hypothetical protein